MIVSDGDNDYDIPDEMEDLFDSMLDTIIEEDEFTDEWYDLTDQFDSTFGEFRI